MATKVKKENSTTEKIKELTGVRPEKINEQQLAQLKSSIQTIETITSEVGGLEVRKHSLMTAMERIHSRLEALRVVLEKEYGTDNISLEDGTITYTETQAENGKADKKD